MALSVYTLGWRWVESDLALGSV